MDFGHNLLLFSCSNINFLSYALLHDSKTLLKPVLLYGLNKLGHYWAYFLPEEILKVPAVFFHKVS